MDCVCVCMFVLFNLHAIPICAHLICMCALFLCVFFYRWKYSFNQTVPTDSMAEKSISFILFLFSFFFHSPKTANNNKKNDKYKLTNALIKIYDLSTIWNSLPIDSVFGEYLLSQQHFKPVSVIILLRNEMLCSLHQLSRRSGAHAIFIQLYVVTRRNGFIFKSIFIVTTKWSQNMNISTWKWFKPIYSDIFPLCAKNKSQTARHSINVYKWCKKKSRVCVLHVMQFMFDRLRDYHFASYNNDNIHCTHRMNGCQAENNDSSSMIATKPSLFLCVIDLRWNIKS